MAMVRVKARIDKDGILTATMPVAVANQTVDVLVEFPQVKHVADSEILNLLGKSFGISPDLERPEQGELPPPKAW